MKSFIHPDSSIVPDKNNAITATDDLADDLHFHSNVEKQNF
ncbi:hypothetical protein [Desulfocicer vacuolatum]|nr:hypothetical protein [Desulfocicer vacuolatum]